MLLTVLLCAGCATHYRGGDLPEIEDPAPGVTPIDVTWDIEWDVGPVGPNKVVNPPSRLTSLLEHVFSEAAVFQSATRGAPGACHIHIIDRSWHTRNGWEVASAFVSLVTLGIIPGYMRDDYDLEFIVHTADGETSYRYKDYTKTLWGVWGLFFPRDQFSITIPAGESEKWGESPDAAVLQNMVRHFLVDFERDYCSTDDADYGLNLEPGR